MSDNFYYHKEKAGVDLYLDRAMNAEATATRRKELLRRAVTLIMHIRPQPDDLLQEIEKELADDG